MSGRVILVGAGVGGRSITVAGLDALRGADAVLHDRLVDPGLLAEARGDALLIDVGARGGEDGAEGRQRRIAERMISLAREGKSVVRLKGGDPFVFGRGGEEVSALAAAGIAVELIPGVSAAVAAPGLAGMPVTDRRAASAFTVVTGRPAAGAPPADWEALARVGGTIVVLMGGRRAGGIARRLIAAGMDAGTPAAAISRAGGADQRTATAPLEGLAAAIAEAGLATPITLVIGQVVALRAELAGAMPAPAGSRAGSASAPASGPTSALPSGPVSGASPAPSPGPLAGRRVLVTRPAGQAEALAARLRAAGAEAAVMPTIEILPPDDGHAAADAAAARLAGGGFDWAVFTSANGAARFRARLDAGGLDARAFGGVRVAAIGPATAAALAEFGIRADLVAEPHTAAALARALAPRAAGARVLLARSAEGEPGLAAALRAGGAEVSDAAVYRAAAAAGDAALLRDLAAGRIDAVAFTSPSTVRGLIALAGPGPGAMGGARIACIGPVTAAAARAAGLAVDVEAQPHTAGGLVRALAAALDGEPPAGAGGAA